MHRRPGAGVYGHHPHLPTLLHRPRFLLSAASQLPSPHLERGQFGHPLQLFTLIHRPQFILSAALQPPAPLLLLLPPHPPGCGKSGHPGRQITLLHLRQFTLLYRHKFTLLHRPQFIPSAVPQPQPPLLPPQGESGHLHHQFTLVHRPRFLPLCQAAPAPAVERPRPPRCGRSGHPCQEFITPTLPVGASGCPRQQSIVVHTRRSLP
jgi:hypothetical protein